MQQAALYSTQPHAPAPDRLAAGERVAARLKGVVPGAEYVSWVAKRPNDLVLVHDLRSFLSRAEAAALADVLAVQPAVAAGGSP